MKKIKYYNFINKYYYYLDDDGNYHNDDGPAVEYCSGLKQYIFHGKLHRTDGPAVEYSPKSTAKDKTKSLYYLDGKYYSFKDWDRIRKMLWLL